MHECRICKSNSLVSFCDLGTTPLANSYLKHSDHDEPTFPLHAFVCEKCFLVQLDKFESPHNLFSDYAYFSSYSSSWLSHAKNYAAAMTDRFSLSTHHQIIEIASNDGYLLQYFKEKNIPVLGIEPAQNVAQIALQKGIPTIIEFFGQKLANQLPQKADLLIANNVLAHVPDLHDFVAGLSHLLAPAGILTIEFPHLLQLIQYRQFDTIYHEHFSYFSLTTAQQILNQYQLEIFDVEEIPSHGGSLRLFVQHSQGPHSFNERVNRILEKEISLTKLDTYLSFTKQIEDLKKSILEFLLSIKKSGKKIAAYGAPAKGNTLLNYCNITPDLIPFTVDISPHKQGLFLPGSRLPIYSPSKIEEFKPDYLLILPWNLKSEIIDQMRWIKAWKGQFVVPIPNLELI